MAQISQMNPHKQFGDYSPLQILVHRALRRYGDMNPGTIEGDVSMLFIDFANEIIEDIRMHPYWVAGDIDYYISLEESRPVPDLVIVMGLCFRYALQQFSDKQKLYGPLYYQTMNKLLYDRNIGKGHPQFGSFDIKRATIIPQKYTIDGVIMSPDEVSK